MTSIEQTNIATAPEASHAVQPGDMHTLPAPTAPVAPTAAAKTPIKKVMKTPAKKVAEPVKARAAAALRPVVQSVAKKAPLAATRPVAKTVAKPVVKAAPTVAPRVGAKAPAKTEPKAVIAATPMPKVEKLLKPKKPKLVRDSFTIPKLEYLILEELKQRSGKLGNAVKKSELIRAGIKALAAMSNANFLAALKAVPAIKTGRPAND